MTGLVPPQIPSKFDSDWTTNFMFHFTTVVTSVNLFVAPLFIYTILTRSKALGLFKWHLLNHVVWCLLFEVVLSLAKPVNFLPAVAFVFKGPWINAGTPTTSAVMIMLIATTASFTVGGLYMSLAYRYTHIYPGMFLTRLLASKTSYAVYLLIHLFCLLSSAYYANTFIQYDHAQMLQRALEFDPLLQPFFQHSTFLFIERADVFSILIVANGLLILCIILLIVIPCTVWAKISKLSSQSQMNVHRRKHMLAKSMVVQALVTIVFQLIPVLVIFSLIISGIDYGNVVCSAMFCVLSIHATLEMLCVLYFVVPYRRFLVKKLTFFLGIFHLCGHVFHKPGNTIVVYGTTPLPTGSHSHHTNSSRY